MAGLQLGYLNTPEYQQQMAKAGRKLTQGDIFGALLLGPEREVIKAGAAGAMKDYAVLLGLSQMKKEREVYMPEKMGIRREELGLRREELDIRSRFQEKELAQRSEQARTMAGLRMKGIESEAGIRESELEERERGMKKALPWQIAGVGISGLSAWQQIKQAQDERNWKRGLVQKYGLSV